jgi:hypothetical protein
MKYILLFRGAFPAGRMLRGDASRSLKLLKNIEMHMKHLISLPK